MPTTTKKNKLLLIGWDAADWKAIHPLLDSGKMPSLEAFINQGVMGNLSTLDPPLSPMLWTSVATGKRPYKHGIHGFSEPDPVSGAIRPITNLSRTTKAMWNILSQKNLRCNVVGWWPSHPAEPINGVMVSNHYQRAETDPGKPWPMKPGTVHPERLRDPLKELRLHPADVDPEVLQLFVPDAGKVDQEKDKHLVSLAKIIADTVGIHNAATYLMQKEPWDFMAVYYDAIDHFGHGFMKYHPPRRDWVKEEEFALYQHVVEGGYRYHDLMLGALLELAGPDTTVMLISDHGFHPDNLRPNNIPIEPAGPAAEHSPYGIFVMRGEGIKKDECLYAASLIDITPTVLHHFGLPVGDDMDGKTLLHCYENPAPVEHIASWDAVDGDSGRHPPDMQLDPAEASELLAQLVDLGYIDEPGEDQEKALASTVHELRYNLARAYVDGGLHPEAAEEFRALWEAAPNEHRYGVGLLNCLLAQSLPGDAREVFEKLVLNKKADVADATTDLREFKEKHKDKKPEDWSRKDQFARRKLMARTSVNPANFALLEGRLLYEEGRYAESMTVLDRIKNAPEATTRTALLKQTGTTKIRLRKYGAAITDFERAIEIDPNDPGAFAGLAQACLRAKKHLRAAGAAVDSVSLLYGQPRIHFVLGVALHRLARFEEAAKAYEVATTMSPALPDAHRRLANIYQNQLNNPEAAEKHRARITEAKRRRLRIRRERGARRVTADNDTVEPDSDTAPVGPNQRHPEPFPVDEAVQVVAGLPRSGTSMVMQMLVAGGMDPLCDDKREADDSNPRGYLELERVKSLGRDASWLGQQGRGKVTKIVAPLIPALQRNPRYQVVFIHRDLDEVVASQRAMLERLGRKGAKHLTADQLKRQFRQQVVRARSVLQGLPSTRVLDVRHENILKHPQDAAREIAGFFRAGLDIDAMAACVDPSLHREKKKTEPPALGGTAK